MKYLVSAIISFLLVACNSDMPGLSDATPQGKYVSQDGKATLIFSEGGKVSLDTKAGGTRDGTYATKDGVVKWQLQGAVALSFQKNADGTWFVPELAQVYVKQ